jgi:Pyruvate/2-oxoacid:ferredoxin oxidoreductase delta subunit
MQDNPFPAVVRGADGQAGAGGRGGAVPPIGRLPPHPAWPLRGSGSRAGNCFGCDNCYGVCLDNAIVKLGTGEYRYEIDYDYCKGCGLSASPDAAVERKASRAAPGVSK